MARQNINRGTLANDGTGDTLRTAAKKINDNFVEMYRTIGGDSDIITSKVSFVDSGLSFEGDTLNNFKTLLTVTDPTASRTATLPNASGNVVLDTTQQTLTNKTLNGAVLAVPQIQDTSSNHQYVFVASELVADRNVTLPILGTDDTFVFADVQQTLTNKSLTQPNLNAPMIGGKANGGFLEDSAGNELIEFDRVASALNHIKVSNTATGASPKIESLGGDANVSLNLAAKGTGAIDINSKLVYNVDTVTSSTAVNLLKPLTIFNASSGLIIPTLAAGALDGETHKFVARGGAVVHLTGNNNIAGADSNASFFRFEQNSTLSLLWDGNSWQTMSSLDSATGTSILLK